MAAEIAGQQRVTLGADKGYDQKELVRGLREHRVTPHVAQKAHSAIDRRTTVRRPLDEVVHYDRYDESKYMSNQQVLSFLHELRGRTMPAYHTKPATDGAASAAGH